MIRRGADVGERAPPGVLPAWTPVRALGSGSLCEVLLVELEDGRSAALKRATPEHRTDPRVARILREEAALHAQLAHPAIPRLLAHGETPDGPALVMEHITGAALDVVVPGGATLSAPEVAHVAHTLLDALAFVHARGLVHRDVGAHNVMVAHTGDVVLIDFGIALADARERWTATGGLRGALAALSPEAVRGEPVTHAADLFAAGALVFALLFGHEPFSGRGRRALLSAIAKGARAPVPADATQASALDAFFARALAAQQADRFASAEEMRAALASVGLATDHPGARETLAQRVAPLVVHDALRERTVTKT